MSTKTINDPPTAQRYALLGWPVKHSVSPQMQGAGFQALGIDATYELIEVHPKDLGVCVERLRDTGFAGWNVTVPHKEQVIDMVNHVDPGARAAGSVNTVINRGGVLHGFSTDGYGLEAALRESFGVALRNKVFTFIGTGGAARATSVYFACQGAAHIVLVNRTVAKAERLAETIAKAAPECRLTVIGLGGTESIRKALPESAAIIQGTSLGLHEGDPLPFPPEQLPPDIPVMDMIYRTTPFLAGAAQQGCPTADGRGMLLHQGVRSFELWTDRTAPVDAMRAGLETALTR
ncbi:MAG: shikimate dehydrogenase [Lentisphaerae bacterium]|jgi:shikimate dehydrogenase|nr:shikimate dehydrogenase [Lentisphaerota bacterium]MBT4818053.1 shikimate dehydrogenase [Lentisphaerota bacterium]MBT5605023.1 shikimate dehydrogenase [Lentisphaerota bacterium]MBT7054653.1 shikimate dehydrogenase [Lentisphaerota bacterium]MBT7844682.1 shikimate dehydrogenase [Lentisphaerota bacterium]